MEITELIKEAFGSKTNTVAQILQSEKIECNWLSKAGEQPYIVECLGYRITYDNPNTTSRPEDYRLLNLVALTEEPHSMTKFVVRTYTQGADIFVSSDNVGLKKYTVSNDKLNEILMLFNKLKINNTIKGQQESEYIVNMKVTSVESFLSWFNCVVEDKRKVKVKAKEIKTGDIVECVIYERGISLTTGKTYTVIDVINNQITVVNDRGIKGGYFTTRFKLANETTKKIAVHVPTQDDWNNVLMALKSERNNDDNYSLNGRFWYKKNSCINISSKYWYYSSIEYYKNKGYKIISVDEFFKSRQKEKSKVRSDYKPLDDILNEFESQPDRLYHILEKNKIEYDLSDNKDHTENIYRFMNFEVRISIELKRKSSKKDNLLGYLMYNMETKVISIKDLLRTVECEGKEHPITYTFLSPVTVAKAIVNGKHIFGFAVCHENDKWNERTGKEVSCNNLKLNLKK